MTTVVQIVEDVYQVTVTDPANIVVQVGEPGPAGPSNSSLITVTPSGVITGTNVQDAITQLANLFYQQATAPVGAQVTEGDIWYDSTADILKVYKNGIWESVIIQPDLADANLNGGYF